MEKLFTSGFAAFVLMLCSVQLFSQSVDIVYKVKGKNQYSVRIFFSDKNGAEGLTSEEFQTYEHLNFTIQATEHSEREYFKSSDLEENLSLIQLIQEGKTIPLANAPAPVTNPDEKIVKYILSYPKSEVLLHKPFTFTSQADTSETIGLSDEYFPQFSHYKAIYEEGYELSHDRKFVESFDVLFPIVQDAETIDEIRHYTFYNHLSEILMERVIRGHADSLAKVYLIHSNRFRKSYERAELLKCDSVQEKFEHDFVAFEHYMKMDFPKCAGLKAEYDKMLVEVNNLKNENHELFKSRKLSFFQTSSYDRDFKFGFYLDVIARLIVHKDAFAKLDKLEEIDITLLDKMPEKKSKLELTEWMEDFEIIVGLINEDIHLHHYVFSDSVMNNLYNHHEHQPQPYYEIFKAFSLLSQDQELFRFNLNKAMIHCSDEYFIRNMEMWMLSSMISDETASPKLLENINNGIRLINANKLQEAARVFDVITMQANTLAMPWYYSGLIAWENDEKHVAQNRFDLALNHYPNYIAPRLYIFNYLFETGDYDQLLTTINLAIVQQDIWIYQYWKARALYAKKQYREALICLNDNCLVMNPLETETWFLLGDIYFDMKDLKSAREAYNKTQVINPYDHEKYNRIMTEKF